MAVSQQDIAIRAGVSQFVVSCVLNNRDKDARIAPETCARVLEIARELGYRPNRIARALATGKSHIIAFWTTDPFKPYSVQVLKRLDGIVHASGYETVLGAHWSTGQAQTSQWPVDGIIALEILPEVDIALRQSATNHIPIVTMGGPAWNAALDAVYVDLYSGGREVMQHLLGSGYRRIAFAADGDGSSQREARYAAYITAMREAGLHAEFVSTRDGSRAEARHAIKEYVQKNGNPEALFCISDDTAIAAYRAIYDLRLRIPEDIAVVGCDDIDDAQYLEPPLSTIAQPVEEMCVNAWQFLRRRIEIPSLERQQITLQPQFIIRESSIRQSENRESTNHGG